MYQDLIKLLNKQTDALLQEGVELFSYSPNIAVLLKKAMMDFLEDGRNSIEKMYSTNVI